MALIIADRVLVTSTTTGTGAYTLGSPVTGFTGFNTVCANGDTFYYYAEAVDSNNLPTGDWEAGFGTWGTGNILTRTTIHASSNSNLAVSWPAGTRRIALGLTAANFNTKANLDSPSFTGNVSIGTTPSATYKLDIATTGTGGARLRTAESGGFIVTDGVRSTYISNSATGGSIGTTTNNPLNFITNAVTRATLDTSGNLSVTGDVAVGQKITFNNRSPVYSRFFGGDTDLNWKKIADVTLNANLYSGATFKIDIIDSNSNFGASSDCRTYTFYATCRRSAAVLDSYNDAQVYGPVADFVRVVKTATGVYELQVRQSANYRHQIVISENTSSLNAAITYVTGVLADGSTTGTIYLPTNGGSSANFVNVTAAGTITGTFSGNITGNVTGNASTATTLQTARTIGDVSFNGSANIAPERIYFKDTRSTDFTPNTYIGISLHLKQNAIDSLNDGGTYHGVLNLQQWSDLSGGTSHQLGFTDNNNIYKRQSTSNTTWGSWVKLYDADDAASANTASKLVLRDSAGDFSARNITASLIGNANTATTLATGRTFTVGSTGKYFDGGTNVTWTLAEIGALGASAKAADSELLDGLDSTYFKRKYNAIVRRSVWSRIARFDVEQLYGSVMVTFRHTRNSVVVGNVFLVSFGHNLHGQLTLLGSHGYSQVQVRLVGVGDGNNVYFEIFDSAVSDGTDDNDYTVTLDNINCTATAYTAFTDGTQASPSILSEVTTANNEIIIDGNKVWHQGNDGASSTLDADLLDGQQGSWYQDWTNITNKPDPVITLAGDATGSVTLTDLASGTLTVAVVDDSHTHDGRYYTETEIQTSTIYARDLRVYATGGIPTVNLGSPSISEKALFDAQFNNKTEFYDIANMFVESSTDGTTWTTFAVTDSQKRILVGGDAYSSLTIPYNTPYFRIRFRAVSYVYLNELYTYFSSNGHSTQVHIYKKHDSGAYTAHTTSTTTVSGWPGHIYLPFPTIPFHPTGTLGSHFHEVYVVFIPSWNATYSANGISLSKLQIWGGYPAGKRNVFATDELANVTFPATVNATTFSGALSGNATTATTATNWGNYGAVPAVGTSFGTPNTIGRSDSNGYTFFNYINSNTGNGENGTVAQIITTNGTDNYYRKSSIAQVTSAVQTNASGSWGISITGNAATATSASTIDGVPFNNSNSGSAVTAPDTLDSNGIGYVTNISLFSQSDGALYSQAYSAAWQHQIFGDYRTGQIAVRGKNNGTWQSWRTIWDSSNLTNLNQLTNGPGYTSNTGTVTSVGGTGTVSGLTLSGTVTTSGNLTLGGTLAVTASNFASQTANTFLAAPNGAAGTPTFRALVAADVPTLNQNTTGSAATLTTARTINGVSFNGSANIVVPTIYDSAFTSIVNPGGAIYTTGTTTLTGAIAITLPVGMTNTMIRMTIRIYEYTTNESFDVYCGGYPYSTGNTWTNSPFAYIVGNPGIDRRFTVRFGYTAAGKAVVYIGELASTWSYPQVFVTDLQCGYGGQAITYTTGWSIGFQSSAFENVTASITNAQVGYAVSTNTANSTVLRDGSGNFSAGTITATLSGNASTATALATARTLTIGSTGKTFNGSANVSWTLAEIGALGASAKAADSELIDGFDSSVIFLARSTFISANTADFNTVTTTGSYQVGGDGTWTGSTNSPTSAYAYGLLEVFTNGNLVTQRYVTHSGSETWVRSKYNASDWQAWRKLWDSVNLTNLNQLTNGPGYTSNTGTVTSVGGTGTVSGLTLSGTVTTSGNLTLGGTLSVAASNFASQTANTVLIAPNGTAGTPTFRALVAADIPTLNQNTTGTAAGLTVDTDWMKDRGSVLAANVDTATSNGFYRQSNTSDSQGLLVINPGGSLGPLQMTFTYGGLFQFRNKTDSTTWNAWKTVLTSLNYNSYSPTLTGTGASGSWGISITGNAANVTGTVAIGNGGTGATTASAALTALGAYAATNPSGYTSNTGTVTSVGGTGTVSGLTLSGTVTTTGNLTLGGTLSVTASNFASQTANTVLIAPNGTAGTPTFRALVAADIPTLNQNTTGTASNVTGTVAIANGGTGATTAAAARTALGATTLGANLLTVTNPTAVTFLRVNADNTVSTLDAATFRTAIGAGTSSTTGTVTSVGGTGTVSGLTLSGTVTTTGNLTLSGTLAVTASNFASQTANTVLAAPNGAAGTPTFRALVAADIPTLNQNTTGTAASIAGGTSGSIPYQVSPGNTGFSGTGTAGQLLQSNLTSAPSWVSTGTLTVGKATNIVGGAAGSIPYQTAADTTGMISAGTTGQLLKSNGSGSAPTWVDLSAVNYDKIESISITLSANAVTITLAPTTLSFRNSLSTVGVPSVVTSSSSVSITIPAGATLGTVNSGYAQIAIVALNNAGTIELGVVNIQSPFINLNEQDITSTVAISSSSNSSSYIYTTVARSSLPYRVVGLYEAAIGTAGNWTSVTQLTGTGGLALSGLSTFGIAQYWTAYVIGSNRVSGVTYYNYSFKPKFVYANLNATTGCTAVVSGVTILSVTNGQWMPVSFVVPPRGSYTLTAASGISSWAELG